MSKITLDSIGSNYASTTKINENFQKLQDELNNKVHYRDNPEGEANTLSGDVDMDSNDIINAKSISTKEVIVNGVVLPYGNNDYLPLTGGALTGTLSGSDAVASNNYMPQAQVLETIDIRLQSAPNFDPNSFQNYGLITEGINDTNDYGGL